MRKRKVSSGKISQGHAKVLVGLDEKKQKIIIDSIIGQKLSVRDAENMVKKYKSKKEDLSKKHVPTLLEKYRDDIQATLPFKHKVKAKSIEISLDNESDIKNFLNFLKKL